MKFAEANMFIEIFQYFQVTVDYSTIYLRVSYFFTFDKPYFSVLILTDTTLAVSRLYSN